MLKLCSVCKEDKEVTEFWKNNQTSDGVHPCCKECARKRQKIKYNKYKDKISLREKGYRAKHASRIKKTNHAWYEKNKDRLREYSRKWKNENRDKVRIYEQRRTFCLKKATPYWINSDQLKQVYEKAKEMTIETGKDYVVDHIYPIEHPILCGLNVPWNLQIITRSENARKGKSLPEGGNFGAK